MHHNDIWCPQCFYGKRINHNEHGAWHEYECKLKRTPPCKRDIFKPKSGTFQSDMIKYFEKESK